MKKWWIFALAALTLLSLIAEFTSHDDHGHSHWWNKIPGFYIFFGLLGCIVLILFAKNLGKYFLSKEENYYDDK
jgi:hypothetical protein